MANGTYAPDAVFTGLDNNGNPISGGKLFIYEAGTSTKATTWSNIGMTVANANPLILDASGRGTVVLLPGNSYKEILAPANDTDPPTSPYWTRDNISAIPPTGSATDNDIGTAVAGEAISINDACYLSDGSGGLTAGRWYRCDADQTYSSVAAYTVGFAVAAISLGGTGTVRVSGRVTGLSGLTAGTLYYVSATAGNITATPPANARLIAVADTTTSAIVSPWIGGTVASATIGGVLTAAAQEIGGTKSFMNPPLYAPGLIATADATVSGVIHRNVVPVGNVGGGTDTLMTMQLLANTLDVAGKTVRVTAWGICAANANNKTLTFNLGADSLACRAAADNNTTWEVAILLVRITANTEYVSSKYVLSSGGGTWIYSIGAFTRNVATGDHALSFTGVGTADNDIRQDGMIVEVVG